MSSNVKSKFMTFLLRALKRMAEVWSHIPAYIYISRVPTVSWNFWKRDQSCILKRNSQFNKFFGDIGESMDNCGVSHTCCMSWWFSSGFLQWKLLLTPFSLLTRQLKTPENNNVLGHERSIVHFQPKLSQIKSLYERVNPYDKFRM